MRMLGGISRVRLRSGFTLIELVISSALMIIIIAAAYVCLSSGFASQKLVETRGDAVQSARVALGMITADLRAACPLSKKIEFLGMDRDLEDGTEADNLDFATHNYSAKRAREADFCEVSYFVSKDEKTGVTSLWRRRDPTLDDDPFGGGSREELVHGVEGIRFEYYDGYEWFDDWGDPTGGKKVESSNRFQPNLSGMPEAVRITLWVNAKPEPAGIANDEEPKTEPGLAFQTVARLNLVRPVSSSTTGTPSDTQNTQNTQPQQPDGGGQQ